MKKIKHLHPAYRLFIILMIGFVIFFFTCYQCFVQSRSNIINHDIKNNDSETIKADHYEMTLHLDSKTHQLYGTVNLTITNQTKQKISSLYLRNYACAITGKKSIQSIYQNKKQLSFHEFGAPSVLDKANIKNKMKSKDIASIIKIQLDNRLSPKKTMTLSIQYQIDIPKRKDRFGYTKINNQYMYQLSYCFIQLSPFINGQWDNPPYIDHAEPDFNQISNYSIDMTIPDGYILVSSGHETYKGDHLYHIEAKQVSNIAMIVSNHLKKETINFHHCQINHYYPVYDNMQDYSQYILDSAQETMAFNTQHFGQYPYQQLDIVSCYYDSAMEYSGMIFLGLPDIQNLNHLDQTSYSSLTQTVAHEVSHQWFCIALGNDQYNEPWLDEGFAEYIEDILFPLNSKVYQKAIKDDKQRLKIDIDDIQKEQFQQKLQQMIKQKQNQHYINEPYHQYIKYEKPDGLDHKIMITDDYSNYVYTQGSYLLYELSQAMKENTFYQMMQDYYQTYYLKEVTTADFINKVYQYDCSPKIHHIINKYIDK